MALPVGQAACDRCRGQYKTPVQAHLGEVVTPLHLNFCSEDCRDQFITAALTSDKLDREHKLEILEQHPHLRDAHIEGLLSHHKHSKQAMASAKVEESKPIRGGGDAVEASLITALKRRVSDKVVVDTNRIASDLIKRVQYYASRLDNSEAQVPADAEAVPAPAMGRVAEMGYTDVTKARAMLRVRFQEAMRYQNSSQDYFPQSNATKAPSKASENPSWSNKELGVELASLVVRSANPAKGGSVNTAQMALDVMQVVQRVIDATGEAGYLFLLIFPFDLRTGRREADA